MGNQSNEQQKIVLQKPDMSRTASLMEALANRKSTRSFHNKLLDPQDLSDLLWAANGINRPDTGGSTASNSLGQKEVDIYVCTPEGACLYCAATHSLIPVTATNLMPALAGGQEYVLKASTVLLIVAETSIFAGDFEPYANLLASLDGGIVSQNIYLFCAGNKLNTVARMTMDQQTLRTELKLKDSQCLLLNHPVGYANI